MSFADPRLKGQPAGRAEVPTGRRLSGAFRRRFARSDASTPPVERPRGKPYRRSVDWERVGLVSAGLLIGALVGAGAALLFAPQSGEETRIAIGRRARHARLRARTAWDDLADELAEAARRGRRRARRAITHARWRASDAMT